MARKFGCLTALLVTGLASFGIWVNLPSAKYAEEARNVLAQASERDRADRELAKKNPDDNGYLNSTLLPVWGRKDLEGKPDSEIYKTFLSLVDLSDLAYGRDNHLEEAVKSRDAKVLGQMHPIEKLYPEIKRAARAKKFLVPYEEEVKLSRLVPNWLGFLRVSHACAGYAELLTLQGKSDEALAVCSDMLAFARQTGQQQKTMTALMFQTNIQNVALRTAVMVLKTSQPSAGALSSLAKELRESQPDSKCVDQALENDLLLGTNALEELAKDSGLDFLVYIPGLVGREKRMYHNDYMPILISRQSGQAAPSSPESLPTFGNWFLGRRSVVGPMLIPKVFRSERVFQLARKRQGFLHLAVELRLRKASTLKDLKDYKPLDGFDPGQVQVEKGVIRYQLSPEEIALWAGPYQEVEGMEKWSALDAGRKEWVLP